MHVRCWLSVHNGVGIIIQPRLHQRCAQTCSHRLRQGRPNVTERTDVKMNTAGCVCNAGSSNAGRSLCVQISRERSYLQPIYWYDSKGNSLRYNFAVESFYIMKRFRRLFVLYCRNCPKDDKFRYFIPTLRKLGAAKNRGWWLDGKPVLSSC